MEISDMDVTQMRESTYLLIPSRFPPVDLYERVASREVFDTLHEIESLTNNRLRDEVGEINLVAREDFIAGPGANQIMAAFTHIKPDHVGGRFNKGFGVYYCAREPDTAIEETKFHRAKFYRDFASGPTRFDMRELVADLRQELHTIANKQEEMPDVYSPDDYSAGQALGRELKNANSWGLQYSSVRTEGVCYAVLRPPALSGCRQSRHLEYHFDGENISLVIQKMATE